MLSDVLGHIDGVTSKKMFGGYGLYYCGTIFGIITDVDERIFFHTPQHNNSIIDR